MSKQLNKRWIASLGVGIGLLAAVLGVNWVVSRNTTENIQIGVVDRYFRELSGGDLDALAAISADGGPAQFGLTSAAITSAASAAPITDLNIAIEHDVANVTYAIAGGTVSAFLDLEKTEDGWQIKSTTSPIRLTTPLPPGVLATANGAPVSQLSLTPGLWEVGTNNKYVVLSPDSLLVDFPNPSYSGQVAASLTKDGQKAIRAAIGDAVAECESKQFECASPEINWQELNKNVDSLKCEFANHRLATADVFIDAKGAIVTDQDFYVSCTGTLKEGRDFWWGASLELSVNISDPDHIEVGLKPVER